MANFGEQLIIKLARTVQQQLAVKDFLGPDQEFLGPYETDTGGLSMEVKVVRGLTLELWIDRFSGEERLWYGFSSGFEGGVAQIVDRLKEWKPHKKVLQDSDLKKVRWRGGAINQLMPPLRPSQLGVLTYESYAKVDREFLGVFSKKDIRKAAVRDLAEAVVGMVVRLNAIVSASDWGNGTNSSALTPIKRSVGARDEIIMPRHAALQGRYIRSLGAKANLKENDRFVDIVIYGTGSAIETLVEVKPTRNIGETRFEFRQALGQLFEARWRLCRNSKSPPRLIVVMDHEPRANTKAFAKSVGCVCAWPAKRGKAFIHTSFGD